MFAAILLSIILNGYIITRFTTYHYVRLHRFQGQLLYLKVISIGVFIYIISIIILSIFNFDFIFNKIDFTQIQPHKDDLIANYVLKLLFLSFIFSIFSAILIELWFMRKTYVLSEKKISLYQLRKKTRIYLMYKLLCDSPLDKILFESCAEEKFLLITLKDRKCYVGRVANLGEPNEQDGPDQEILLVPIASGYRDKDTLMLNLTTSYDFTNEQELADKTITIVLKQHEIMSACEYHEELYDKCSNN